MDKSPAEQHTQRSGLFRGNAKLAGVAAGLAAPFALAAGIAGAEIHDTIGPNEATISTNFNHETVLNAGPIGNAYIPQSFGPIGIDITVGSIRGDSHLNIFSSETLDSYREVFDDANVYVKNIENKLIENALEKGIAAEMLLGAGGFLLLKKRRQLAKPLALTIMSGTLLMPIGIGQHTDADAIDRYPVHMLDNTPLAGTEVSGKLLKGTFENVLPEWKKLLKNETTDREAYIKTADEQLDELQTQMCELGDNEEIVMVISDTHSSKTSVAIQKKIVDICQPTLLINSGDISDNGVSSENTGVKNEVNTMAEHKNYVGILGNHDSNDTGKAVKSAGGTLLEGKTETVQGIKLLGYPDPVVNYPYSSDRYQRSEKGPQTEEDLGKAAYEEAKKSNPDILVVHEPDAVDAFKAAASGESLPAKLIINGHIHKADGPYPLPNTDGMWAVQYQSGTTGGKKALSATGYWTPNSTPGVDATTMMFFLDTETHEPVAWQLVTLKTDGEVKLGDKTYVKIPESVATTTTKRVPDTSTNDQAQGNVTRQEKK